MKKKAKKSKGKDRVQVVKDKITQENERHKEKMSKLNRKLAELTDPNVKRKRKVAKLKAQIKALKAEMK